MSAVPSEPKLIQVEETDFKSPGSEAMLQKIAGSQNYILDGGDLFAVGEILESMLDETELQAIMGTGFVLCDGRAVPGSQYEVITGDGSIPDARGLFPRNQQGSRDDTIGNPDGNVPVGTYQADVAVAHNHNVSTGFNIMNHDNGAIASSAFQTGTLNTNLSNLSISIDAAGGAETRPRCLTINLFIRIN